MEKLPDTQQEAFVDSALYTCFDISGTEGEQLDKFFLGHSTVDAWCVQCKKTSVFQIKNRHTEVGRDNNSLTLSGSFIIEANCGRGGTDSYYGCPSKLVLAFTREHGKITKIGQYPQASKLEFGALDDAFSKELSDDFRKELGTAIGLRPYGVGIGSFVYLRRIFEALVEESHQVAKTEKDWDEEKYERARFFEKIVFLKKYLPSRLVESSHLYGIMSLGIHELSEEQCLGHFELVKGAIEFILKQRHEEKQYKKITDNINAEANKLNKKRTASDVT